MIFTLAFAGMATRLVFLQIFHAHAYARLAVQQREREITFPARRGAIFDRNGQPLALSVDLHTVYTDPQFVENPPLTAARLAPVLGREPEDIAVKLAGTWPGDQFEYLARQVEPDIARRVKDLGLPGIYLRREPRRYYPGGELASHLLGFADIDGRGIAGIEMEYESLLRGEPGRMVLEQDPSGRPLPQADFEQVRPQPGRSLFLTIDKELQYFTELTLANAARTYSANAGSAIVMRPRTGEILALANVPGFDPNEPGEVDPAALRNRALTDMYEPGSAFKIVTASAALDRRAVTPRTAFDVPDAIGIADRVIHDSHPHAPERMTVREIIVQSSNVGTIKIGLELGGRWLDRYVRKFGFGSKTGLDFPGESPGIVIPRDEWSGSTIGNIPIGQSVAVTPLQMAAAYSTIANGGVWVEPKLLHSTMSATGRVESSTAAATRRVIRRKTARQMVEIFKGVVREGTGLEAQIPGYEVAGKTGTAQKPLPGGGYGSSYVGSFAGFAPASDPEIMVLVVFDEPSPIWGGLSAAPTFRTIAEFALRHFGVPPTGNAEKAAREIESERALDLPARD